MFGHEYEFQDLHTSWPGGVNLPERHPANEQAISIKSMAPALCWFFPAKAATVYRGRASQ